MSSFQPPEGDHCTQAEGVPWGHVGLHSSPVANFKATVLLNAKGLTKLKRSSREIRNTHRKKEGAPAGDKCHRKEPGGPSGRPGRALATRGRRSTAGSGRRERGWPGQRPSRKAARRRCQEAGGGEPGSEAECAAGRPSRLPAEPGAQLVKDQRGPSARWARAPPGPSGLSPLSCKS